MSTLVRLQYLLGIIDVAIAESEHSKVWPACLRACLPNGLRIKQEAMLSVSPTSQLCDQKYHQVKAEIRSRFGSYAIDKSVKAKLRELAKNRGKAKGKKPHKFLKFRR